MSFHDALVQFQQAYSSAQDSNDEKLEYLAMGLQLLTKAIEQKLKRIESDVS